MVIIKSLLIINPHFVCELLSVHYGIELLLKTLFALVITVFFLVVAEEELSKLQSVTEEATVLVFLSRVFLPLTFSDRM